MSTPSKGPYTVELNKDGMRLEGPGMPEGNAEGFGFPEIHVSSKKLYANALAKCLSAAYVAGAERAAQLEGLLKNLAKVSAQLMGIQQGYASTRFADQINLPPEHRAMLQSLKDAEDAINKKKS